MILRPLLLPQLYGKPSSMSRKAVFGTKHWIKEVYVAVDAYDMPKVGDSMKSQLITTKGYAIDAEWSGLCHIYDRTKNFGNVSGLLECLKRRQLNLKPIFSGGDVSGLISTTGLLRKIRDPVRSPIVKPVRGGSVVGSVTTSESPLFS
ncbi:hypothetical protein DER46DRAFT_650294 [Fusarium sp. MPI-SDFR-AT-0072]|nr:hypothetical protein DER46DRAFT_650294 [Fusarium sp. MPI-SDFR-AT-0072]